MPEDLREAGRGNVYASHQGRCPAGRSEAIWAAVAQAMRRKSGRIAPRAAAGPTFSTFRQRTIDASRAKEDDQV